MIIYDLIFNIWLIYTGLKTYGKISFQNSDQDWN